MKNVLVLLVLLSGLVSAQTASIKIDVERVIGEIDPKIYGVFMEPINFSGRRIGIARYRFFQHTVRQSL